VQRLDVLSLGCFFEVLKALYLIPVLLVAEVESGQIVESSWEIFSSCFAVISISLVEVGLEDSATCFFIFKTVFIEVPHIGESLKVTSLAGFLPHLQVVELFAVKFSLVEGSQSIEGLVVFLLVGSFVELDCLVEVFVDHCALLIENTINPLSVGQFLDKFLSDVTVRTQRNGQQQLAVLALLDHIGFRSPDFDWLCGLRGSNVSAGGSFAPTSVHLLALQLVLSHDVVAHLLVLERSDNVEDAFVSDEPVEDVIELFGRGGGPAEEGAPLAHLHQGLVKLHEDALEIVYGLLYLCWPVGHSLAHSIVHLPDDPRIDLFLLLSDLLIFPQLLLDALKQFLGRSMLDGSRQPVVFCIFVLHLNYQFIITETD
jgi:hypothetical protein